MAFDSRLPDAYREDLEVIETISHEELARLEYAEPHPVQLFMSRWWRRTKMMLKVGLVAGAVGAYPMMTVASHKIDDRPIDLTGQQTWSSPEAGISINLIARELEGAGWAGDRANWHPQTRLTAMPAWQDAMASGLSEYVRMQARLAGSADAPEDNLLAASKLLMSVPGEDMRPRLTSAAEALNRYETLMARGQVQKPDLVETLKAQAALFAGWAKTDREDVSEQVYRDAVEFPASREDLTRFYAAKARAHIAGEMLTAMHYSDRRVVNHPEIGQALTQAERAWRRAAKLKPLIVSNQAGDTAFMSNHLAQMAFFIGEAEIATQSLRVSLEALPEGGLVSEVAALSVPAPDEAASN